MNTYDWEKRIDNILVDFEKRNLKLDYILTSIEVHEQIAKEAPIDKLYWSDEEKVKVEKNLDKQCIDIKSKNILKGNIMIGIPK